MTICFFYLIIHVALQFELRKIDRVSSAGRPPFADPSVFEAIRPAAVTVSEEAPPEPCIAATTGMHPQWPCGSVRSDDDLGDQC